MSLAPNNRARYHCALWGIVMAAGVWCFTGSALPAGSGPGPVIRIEEDWVLEINAPSSSETSPQITNTISPATSLNCKYGVFEINHGTQPDYLDGGLELQTWRTDQRYNYCRHTDSSRLRFAGEVVKYTLGMSINTDNNTLVFEVLNGTSQTWGAFGAKGSISCAIPTIRQDLSEYSPDFSVENSKVGYASFRVNKYSLVAVRYYDAIGLLRTDNTERVAYQYQADAVISSE